jgi:hypothetical protein
MLKGHYKVGSFAITIFSAPFFDFGDNQHFDKGTFLIQAEAPLG